MRTTRRLVLPLLYVCMRGFADAQEVFQYATDDNGDVTPTIDIQVGCHSLQPRRFLMHFNSLGLATVPAYHQTSKCVNYNATSQLVTDVLYLDRTAFRSELQLLDQQKESLQTQPYISIPAVSSALEYRLGVCDTALITTGLPQHCRRKVVASGPCDSTTGWCFIRGFRDKDGKDIKIGIQYYHNSTYATGEDCIDSSYTTTHGYTFSAPCETPHQSMLSNDQGVHVMMSVHDQNLQLQYKRNGVTVYQSINNGNDIANIVFILSLIMVLTTFLPATMSVSKEILCGSSIDSSLYVQNIRVIIFDISASITFCVIIACVNGTCYTLFDAAAERFDGVEVSSIPLYLGMNVFAFIVIARVLVADILHEYQEKISNNSDTKLESILMRIMVECYVCMPNKYLKDRRMDRPECYVLVRQIFECQILTTVHAFVPGVMVNRLKSLFGVLLGTSAAIICGRDFVLTSGSSRIYSLSFSLLLGMHASVNMFLPMLIIADSHALSTYNLAFILPAALSFHGFCAGIITAYMQTKNAEMSTCIEKMQLSLVKQ